MLTAHTTLAGIAILVALVAAAWGGLSYARKRPPGAVLRQLLGLAQTLLIAQVALGLLLVSDDRRAAHDLHYAYGTLSLVAVLAPWLYAPREPRRRLLWFVGATLAAGLLAGRAFMTAG